MEVTKLNEDGRHAALRNHDVFVWLGVACSKVEIGIRRLGFWDSGGKVCKHSNPWIRQLHEDIRSLEDIESLQEPSRAWPNLMSPHEGKSAKNAISSGVFSPLSVVLWWQPPE